MALDQQQFINYAKAQIDAANQILAAHRYDSGSNCYCSRPLPCSIAVSCHSTIRHFRDKLARLDATSPVVVPRPG